LVLLTSLGHRNDAARMEEIGFAAYLTKPVKRSQICECLVTITGKKIEETVKPVPPAAKGTIADAKKRSVRILLAEDNRINQLFALKILNELGYNADAVKNGQEAVKALEMKHYDLVLMDIQMPEMDGLEATAEIRRRRSEVTDSDIPIIAVTAHAMKGDKEQCLEAGMDDYLTKPIDPESLAEKLEHWIFHKPA
jgi:two-component system sensor histidine kinase/response regulator